MGTLLYAAIQTFHKGIPEEHTVDCWVTRAEIPFYKDYDLINLLDDIKPQRWTPDSWTPKFLDDLQCFEPQELPEHNCKQYEALLMLVKFNNNSFNQVRIIFGRS